MSERTREELLEEIKGLRDDAASLEVQLFNALAARDEMSEENQRLRDMEGLPDAVHAFCDVVSRPTGQFVYTVPGTPEANRAILGLFDAINRNP